MKDKFLIMSKNPKQTNTGTLYIMELEIEYTWKLK